MDANKELGPRPLVHELRTPRLFGTRVAGIRKRFPMRFKPGRIVDAERRAIGAGEIAKRQMPL